MKLLIVIWSSLVVSGLTGGVAEAADLAPLYGQPDNEEAFPPQQYTFGTGWYLRGDLTASDDVKLNTLGTLTDKRDWNYGVGGGVGYKFNDYFRADVTGDYLGTQKSIERSADSFGTISTLKSNLRRFDGLVNAYIDLGTWGGFTPYIGAGVGFAGLRLDGSSVNTPLGAKSHYTKYSGETRYDLAWAAMAGLTYSVSANLLVDIGYRYLDLGTYKAPNIPSSPFNAAKTDLNAHEIRAGLRYMIY
ncbi:outer membrane protein [Lichenifustis flavocetrariae]|uniref:Outer membrane beta-barrel protein n=1 Tax=Lichenifustis flavocetrariae TaxID=2949735 RepID=A0AA42CK14_9HYPH|nr:outer membrane beta-barrel protein [Lichenifustis flavocetrariae]MCW6510113.1 outer membrane beta-barrel protein [Lichenifustis flavocetrariae]